MDNMDIETIARDIVDSAIKVHQALGPGLIDEFVDNLIIVENKTVENILPIHQAQLLTYLKLKNCKLGFLINWNVKLIKDGLKRMANGLPETPKFQRKCNHQVKREQWSSI